MVVGLLMYKEYINSIIGNISNYDIDYLECKELNEITEKGLNIEDLSLLDQIFNMMSYDYKFIKSKEHISKEIKLKSFLSKDSKYNKLLQGKKDEDILEIEDALYRSLEGYNDNIDSLSCLDVDTFSMGDVEAEKGIKKIENYIDEITNIYNTINENKSKIDILNKGEGIQDKIEVVSESLEGEETKEEGEKNKEKLTEHDDLNKEPLCLEKHIEENKEDNKESIESEVFVDTIEGSGDMFLIDEDDGEGITKKDSDYEIETVEVKGKKDEIHIEKGKRLVEDERVTDIDDLLAKVILITTKGIVKIPQRFIDKNLRSEKVEKTEKTEKTEKKVKKLDILGFLDTIHVPDDL